MVLNQFLPSKECFHEIIMLFISWHTKYLNNCKWDFQNMFDFICCSSSISEVFDISKSDQKNKLILQIFLNMKYIFYAKSSKWISNIDVCVISYCFFYFHSLTAVKWRHGNEKILSKLCLKFCKSVESSASEQRNSAWILKCYLKLKKINERI